MIRKKTTKLLRREVKKSLWHVMIYIIVVFLLIIFLIEMYSYIAFKEHIIVYPIHLATYPNSNHERNCHERNGCMTYNLTKVDHQIVFRQMKENMEIDDYFPFKLGGGNTHIHRLVGTMSCDIILIYRTIVFISFYFRLD